MFKHNSCTNYLVWFIWGNLASNTAVFSSGSELAVPLVTADGILKAVLCTYS